MSSWIKSVGMGLGAGFSVALIYAFSEGVSTYIFNGKTITDVVTARISGGKK